ncbi:MAG TPA: hypothetical protein VFN38_05110 [Gemmatimonadaceae bacterium]|nr:hypothetical protein [Gemmatimonadaceae bacterium]
MRRALLTVFMLGLAGTAFSGILTYRELFGATALACPAPGAPGTIFGYPACVYGFFMFVVITVVSGLGLRAAASPATPLPSGMSRASGR